MADAQEELELAWAAGFFDGEGYVGSNFRWNGRSRYRRIDIQITQVDPEVLNRFREAVGVGKVYGPYAAKGRRHPIYKYGVATFEGVQQVIDRLKPYLSSIKAKQADKALAYFSEWGESLG